MMPFYWCKRHIFHLQPRTFCSSFMNFTKDFGSVRRRRLGDDFLFKKCLKDCINYRVSDCTYLLMNFSSPVARPSDPGWTWLKASTRSILTDLEYFCHLSGSYRKTRPIRQTGKLWRCLRVTLLSLVSSWPDGGAVERRQRGETLRAQRRQGEQVAAAAGELRSVRTNCQRRQPSQEVMWPVGGAILQGHSCISPRGFLISPPLLYVAHLKLVGFVPSGGKWKAKFPWLLF